MASLLTPMTWVELKCALRSGDLAKLTRSIAERDKYRAFRASLLKEWNSLADYVRYSKFQWLVALNAHGKKISVRPSSSSTLARFSPWSAVVLGACLLGLHRFPLSTIPRSLLGVVGSVGLCAKLTLSSRSPSLALLPNDFPYHFEPGVLHYLLWKLDGFLTLDEVSHARETLLETHHGSQVDSAFFINPPSLRSIPEIDHAHILIFVQL